jgi:hypothetical protein
MDYIDGINYEDYYKSIEKAPCIICAYSHPDNGICVCDAFPGGIPSDIKSGENRHEKLHEKQKGSIIFRKV